jgi:uncharacterized protein
MTMLTGWTFGGLGGEAVAGRAIVLTPAGGVAMLAGDAVIRQSLMLLLATIPGERVMRPLYGCPLDRLVFAPNDATTAGLAIHYVRQAIQRWEPRVTILRLDAGADPSGAAERLRIWLEYRVRLSQARGELSFALDLSGVNEDA